MKDVQIVIDIKNDCGLDEYMKQRNLKTFDEMRVSLLNLLAAVGVAGGNGIFEKVDVCKKPTGLFSFGTKEFIKSVDELTKSTMELEFAFLKQDLVVLRDAHDSLKKRHAELIKENTELIKENTVLKAKRLPTDQEFQYRSEIELLKMERDFILKREGELQKRFDVLQARVDGALDALEGR